jgi:hypothetical protein
MAQPVDPDLASRLARIALGHVTREYPNKLDHVLVGSDDVRRPRDLHPVFYGSFDWHSCVHGYWTLLTLYRLCPDLPEHGAIRAVADAHLIPRKIAGETAYLAGAGAGGFERPYGWAWLLMLAAELERHATGEGRAWAAALKPLTDAFVQRFFDFLPRLIYPIRTGTHANTAFALALAHEYAAVTADGALTALIAERAGAWCGADQNCQGWEPGGDDFLSPALIEAECMRRVLPPGEFRAWLSRFLPRAAAGEPASLFLPAVVSDRTDGKIAHLDGLNLSRAWCWRGLARAACDGDPLSPIAHGAADRHLAAALPHIAGDYAGEHWLGSFALLAVLA